MRALRFAVTALAITPAVALAEPAVPPPDTDHVSVALKAFVDAVGKADAKGVLATLAPTVAIEGLELTTPACQKAFGKKRVKAAKRDALAKCLVSIATPPSWPAPMITGTHPLWEAVIADDCWTFEFQLRMNKGATQVSSFKAFKVCNEEGVVEGGFMDGKLAPPAPPPPSKLPKNVAPNVIADLRIAGNPNILPDPPTKKAITESGRERIIASLKLCLDETGTVTDVTVLKRSGYSNYDAKLQREMKLWKYKPYKVDGQATPVCTAVTFIYSQT